MRWFLDVSCHHHNTVRDIITKHSIGKELLSVSNEHLNLWLIHMNSFKKDMRP